LRINRLRGALLSDAAFSGANLSDAGLLVANLSEAYLYDAGLSGANLFEARRWTENQLREARTLKDATMPNGQKYEDWLKDKEG
jgi:uncharacterized protein YjbI with pentapeptide repeats